MSDVESSRYSIENVDVEPRPGSKVSRVITSEVFGPDAAFLLLIPLLMLALVGLSIWAIVDVSSHSKQDFYEAGSSKVAWIVVIALFTFCYGFGSFIAIYYLLRVRPKVLQIESRRTYSQS
jgi:hypothetical protein